MDKKAFYLGHKGLKIRAMLEEKLDFIYNEHQGKSIDIREFTKNKLRNISVPQYVIVEVASIHAADPDSLIELKNSMLEMNEGFKQMILLINESIDKNIADALKSHSRGGKSYILIEESDEEKLIEKLENKIIEIEEGVENKAVEESQTKTDNYNNHNDGQNRFQDIENRKLIKTDTASAKEIKRHINKEIQTQLNAPEKVLLEENKDETNVSQEIVKKNKPKIFAHNFEINEDLLQGLMDKQENNAYKSWKKNNQSILVIGCDKKVGATFIAMAFTQSLVRADAYAMYCLVSNDNIALKDKANDYKLMKNADDYYSYNDIAFTRILTDKNANFIIYDIDMQLVKKSFVQKEVAKIILVADGNTAGLRNLETNIQELNNINIDNYDILIVNSIFDENIYNKYKSERVNLYHWRYCTKVTDEEAINQECFSKIIEHMYDLEVKDRENTENVEMVNCELEIEDMEM